MVRKGKELRRENLKERCLIHLGGKICFRCGIRHLSISSYDFHHKVGGKESNISELICNGISFPDLQKELDKCVVVCANCHREIHQFNLK